MPSRPPNLEGTVALQPTVSEVKLPPDWSSTLLGCIFIPIMLVLRPVMVIMGLVRSSGSGERKRTINTVRVKRSDGVMRDVRFEGDLMGAGITLGDDLSIWGSERGGVLIASRAYNHTAHSEIKIEPHSPWTTRIVAIIIIIFLILICFSFLSYAHRY
jgi:hypothetical protein